MSKIFPFISVDNARKAIMLYKHAFHARDVGEITLYKDMIENSYDDGIAHAALAIDDAMLFINDARDQPDVDQLRFTINVELQSQEKIMHAYDVLKHDAKNIYYQPMALGWSDLGFSLKDQFGVIWLIYLR